MGIFGGCRDGEWADAAQELTDKGAKEIKIEASKDGKPPYKHKIKTEAETVRELSGRDPIVINTEADPDYKDEEDDASVSELEKDNEEK